MTTLFISDLHLAPDRPGVMTLFFDLMGGEARQADAVYILGDLFEYWIGDDAAGELGYEPVVSAMAALSASGVPLYFMRGNRDFLAGEHFGRETGATVLPDPTVVDLYGEPVLLTHGDYLCTDDQAHQAFRRMVDDPEWQQAFLDKPVRERMALADDARDQSHAHKGSISMAIMDVNQEAVRAAFEQHDVQLMIHGHTHRPAVHNGDGRRRIVLGDWYEQSSILRCTPDGQALDPAP